MTRIPNSFFSCNLEQQTLIPSRNHLITCYSLKLLNSRIILSCVPNQEIYIFSLNRQIETQNFSNYSFIKLPERSASSRAGIKCLVIARSLKCLTLLSSAFIWKVCQVFFSFFVCLFFTWLTASLCSLKAYLVINYH